MIDLFCIFTTGGLILWSKSIVSSNDFKSLLNGLIKSSLMDEEKTQEYYMPLNGNGIILRWRILNEFSLIFVVVYQQSFNILYTDKLLDLVVKNFKANQLPLLNHNQNIFFSLPDEKTYIKTILPLLNKWENYCKNEIENNTPNPNDSYIKSKTVTPGNNDLTPINSTTTPFNILTPTTMTGVNKHNFVLRIKNPGTNSSA